MNLESDKRLNIQLRLDFSSAPTGEARQAGREDIESLSVTNEPERPADLQQPRDHEKHPGHPVRLLCSERHEDTMGNMRSVCL